MKGDTITNVKKKIEYDKNEMTSTEKNWYAMQREHTSNTTYNDN
jgi:hypothetical protein